MKYSSKLEKDLIESNRPLMQGKTKKANKKMKVLDWDDQDDFDDAF